MSFVLLGILQAQAEGEVFASDFDLLETETLASSASSITFSSLNSTYGSDYKHLQLRMLLRDTGGLTTISTAQGYFNGDNSSSNYAYHRLEGDGSSVASNATTSASDFNISKALPRGNSTADAFGAVVMDILDPFDTSKNTTVRSLVGALVAGETRVGLNSALWMSTAAVDSITIENNAADDLATGTRISLFGIRG